MIVAYCEFSDFRSTSCMCKKSLKDTKESQINYQARAGNFSMGRVQDFS